MEKEGIIGRIKVLMERGADNANSFSKKVGVDPSGFRKKLKGETPITPRDIKAISDAMGVSREWIENGVESKCQKDLAHKVGYQLAGLNSKFIEDVISKAFLSAVSDPNSSLSVIANNLGINSEQKVTTITNKAKNRDIDGKSIQLFQIIKAKDEALRAKDSEIRLLRKILKDNGIEV